MLFDNSRDPGANVTWVGLPAHSYGSVALASPREAVKTAVGNYASPFAPSGHAAAAPGATAGPWLLDAPLQYLTVNSTGGPGPVYFEPGLLDAPGRASSVAIAYAPRAPVALDRSTEGHARGRPGDALPEAILAWSDSAARRWENWGAESGQWPVAFVMGWQAQVLRTVGGAAATVSNPFWAIRSTVEGFEQQGFSRSTGWTQVTEAWENRNAQGQPIGDWGDRLTHTAPAWGTLSFVTGGAAGLVRGAAALRLTSNSAASVRTVATHSVATRSASAPVTGSEWFEYFSAKYGAEHVRWSTIPEFTGPKSNGGSGTIGVLRTRHGDFEVVSGRDGPAASMSGNGFDIVSRMHVEGHASAIMRKLGDTDGVLFINNPEVCSSCYTNLDRMVPAGGRLRIVLPDDTTILFPRGTQ